MRKTVLFIERIFSFYRKPILDQIYEQVDYKLLSGSNNSGIKTLQTEYSESVPSIQYAKNDTCVLLFPSGKIFKYRPKVVISDFAMGMLNLPLIILMCKLLGIKFCFLVARIQSQNGFSSGK